MVCVSPLKTKGGFCLPPVRKIVNYSQFFVKAHQDIAQIIAEDEACLYYELLRISIGFQMSLISDVARKQHSASLAMIPAKCQDI